MHVREPVLGEHARVCVCLGGGRDSCRGGWGGGGDCLLTDKLGERLLVTSCDQAGVSHDWGGGGRLVT